MEKRKPIGLKGYFTRALMLFFVGIIFILTLSFLLFQFSTQTGIVAPANAGEREAREEITRLSQAGTFTYDLKPQFYEYVYFDKNGNVEASSLEGSALAAEIAKYEDKNISYITGSYVFFEDGSSCLFSWVYTARFTNPALYKIFPNAEVFLSVFIIVILAVFFLLFIRSIGKKLGDKLTLVEAASEQIARQDLDEPIGTSAGIQEFNHALQSMEQMRVALREALLAQWEGEQQRKQEIAALAHDIKSPLTVIGGNAELLLEEPLSDEQTKLVQSIHASSARAQQYVKALQQISNLDIAGEAIEQVPVETLLSDLNTALSPLAEKKSIGIECAGENMRDIKVYPFMLARALVNIGENAIRFTAQGGHIKISVQQNENETMFSFEDEGPGFSKEASLHAKEMFWQQDKSRTAGSHYGMGLAIAEKVAQKHSGKLLLENTSHGGKVKLIIRDAV